MKILCFLVFSHFEELCVNLWNVKTYRQLSVVLIFFFFNLPIWWQQSVVISSVISNLLLIIFINSPSQIAWVSHDVSGMPTIWKLFRWGLSSNSVNFSMAILGSKKSSSISHRSVWTFLISFLTSTKPSCSSPWLNSRALVMLTTSCGIWSRSSLVISLFFSWW